VSVDTQAEAFKTRLTANTQAPTYDLDEAQALASLPANYVLIYLQRRSVDNPARLNGTFMPTGWRLSVRVVAKTITNARLLEDRVATALLLNPITLDGETVDVRYEQGGGDFECDAAGYYSALTDFIFVR
jgi:hypothetical protein